MDWLFLIKNLVRVQVLIDERNMDSKRVFEKNGLIKEGILRKLDFGCGKLRDTVGYSILREE